MQTDDNSCRIPMVLRTTFNYYSTATHQQHCLTWTIYHPKQSKTIFDSITILFLANDFMTQRLNEWTSEAITLKTLEKSHSLANRSSIPLSIHGTHYLDDVDKSTASTTPTLKISNTFKGFNTEFTQLLPFETPLKQLNKVPSHTGFTFVVQFWTCLLWVCVCVCVLLTSWYLVSALKSFFLLFFIGWHQFSRPIGNVR